MLQIGGEMAPRPRVSREEIVEAALELLRSGRPESITARELARALNTSTRPLFTWFASIEEVRRAAMERARALYDGYAVQGLSQEQPFLGYALAYVRFAIDEPGLFRLLFMSRERTMSLQEFLVSSGHLSEALQAIMDTYPVDEEQAGWIYRNMRLYTHGIATLCASEVVSFDLQEIERRLLEVGEGMLRTLPQHPGRTLEGRERTREEP